MIFRNELDFKEPQKKLNQLILILDIKFNKFLLSFVKKV